MIKKFLSVTLVAISLVCAPSFAQNTNDNKKCENTEACKTGKKDDGRKERSERLEAEMYKGMNLTDAQKQQIRDLKEKNRKDRKGKLEALKSEKKELNKEQKEAQKEARKQMKEQKEAEKRAFLNDFKKIVGDENYVIFLENQYIMQSFPEGKNMMARPSIQTHKMEKIKKDLKIEGKKGDTARHGKGKKSHKTA